MDPQTKRPLQSSSTSAAEAKGNTVEQEYQAMTDLEQIEKQTQSPITFESHKTRKTLKTREGSFGSKRDVPESMLKKVPNYLPKSDGRKRKKLHKFVDIDANEAGGRNSEKCTLILAVGGTAKALAMNCLPVVGRDHYGVLTLRGKLLNVREASAKKIMYNIKEALGLQQDKEYADTKSLRYGHLMIMVDQAFHSDGRKLSFYTMPEYDSWRKPLRNNANDWDIMYYKCLDQISFKEGQEYFGDLDKHKRYFHWDNEQDGRGIEMVFSEEKADQKKLWIRNFEPDSFRYHRAGYITYRDFINEELILFFRADLERSIPSMVDGLNSLQRKILFYSFKKLVKKKITVMEFISYVWGHSTYYHDHQSLAITVMNMSQDFVGRNNINLLNGNFGTRIKGVRDHRTIALIYIGLSTITRCIFRENDDKVLGDFGDINRHWLSDEPKWYVPIIPFLLVNGTKGIGTSGSSFIPNYNPREIIANIRRRLNGEMMVPMKPWYKGFKGTLERSEKKGEYVVNGLVEEINEQTFRIKELPIGNWTQDYVQYLRYLGSITDGLCNVKDPLIDGYRDKSNDLVVDIEVRMKPDKIKDIMQEGLLKKFKLSTSLSTNNMHVLDTRGKMRKYDTPEEIVEKFFLPRLEVYEKRKTYMQTYMRKNVERLLQVLENKVMYILAVLRGEIMIFKDKADLVIELQNKGFPPIPQVDEEEDSNNNTGQYDYLLRMPYDTFTRVEELKAERAEKQRELQILKTITAKSIWLKDLDEHEKKLDEIDTEEAERMIDREEAERISMGSLYGACLKGEH